MKNKRALLFSLLNLLFLCSFTYAQGENEMKSVDWNFTNLYNRPVQNLEHWKKHNPSNYWNHPDFGKLSEGSPKGNVVEILSKRKADERHFVSIDDPKNVFIQKSLGDLHYFRNGQWLSFEHRVASIAEHLFGAIQQPDPVLFDLSNGQTYIETPHGKVFFNRWQMTAKKTNGQLESFESNWSNYSVGKDGVLVKDIFPGIDLQLVANRGGIKSNLVVKNLNAYSNLESFVFIDNFQTQDGFSALKFLNETNSNKGIGELELLKNGEQVVVVGQVTTFEERGLKSDYRTIEYEISGSSLNFEIKKSWISKALENGRNFAIDPVVTSSNTLALAAITGSGYNATCFNGFCAYNLAVPTPANATVTDVQWSFSYRAQGGCWLDEGANTFLLGSCVSPNQAGFFWFCDLANPGDCTGDNISIFSDISTCLPAPSCTPQNLNFTMRFHRCFGSGGGCSNTCIGAITPWTMTITGRTLEYTNQTTPITLNNTTICQGGTINASVGASFGVPTYSYNWSLNSNMSPSNGTAASSTFSFPNAGTFTIYSTITDACGTVVSSNRTVTINPRPTVTINPSPTTICSGQGTGLTLTSSMANTSYSWSQTMSGVGGATNGSGTGTGTNSSFNLNQILSNNNAVPGTATYTVTPTAGGCAGTPVSVTVTVNPNPSVTNPGSQTICAGQNSTAVTFSGTSGATFNWTNNNTSTGLGASGTGNIASFVGQNTSTTNNVSNITVTPIFGTCPGTAQNFSITVSPPPTVNTVTSQTVCAGQPTTAVSFTGTASSYQWSNSNTAIGLGASGTGNITAFTATNSTTNPITATISVTPVSGSCQGTPTTFTITVNPSPTVTAPQDQSICAGQSTTAVTFSGSAGATFNWSNNNTATGLGASGTGNIASFVGTNTTTGPLTSTVTVTPSANGCNGTPVTFTITVNITPTMTAPTSQTVCAGQQTTAVTFSGSATTYSWANSNSAIGLSLTGTGNITSFTATNTTSSPIIGTIVVTPSSGTCVGTPQNFTITVNPSPTVTAPQDQSICAGQSTTAITFSGSAGATFNWSNNNTATGLGASGTGNIASFVGTNTTTGPLTSTVTVTPSANGCNGTPVTFTITVNITPTMTAPTSQTVCAGQQTTAVTFSGTATTYSWSNSNTAIGLGATGAGNIAAFTANNSTANPITSTISITPTSGTCQGTTTTFTITINPSPTVTAPQNQNICVGQSTTAVTFIGSAGATFNWSNNNTATGLGASGTGNIASFVGTNTTTGPLTSIITVTPIANGCNGTPITFTITVNVTPTMTAPTSQTLCAGQQTTAVTFSGTATTYTWSNSNTTIGLGSTGTGNIAAFTVTNTTTSPIVATISITPASGTCQGTPTTFTINVNPGVNPTFNPIAPICQNATAPALPSSSTNNPAITGTWNPSTISTTSVGSFTYNFTPNASQCANPVSITIQILPLVSPTFNQIGPICQNTGASLPTSSTNSPAITGTWNPSTVNTSTVGITTYTFTPNPNQCASNTTMNIEVITNPTVTISTQSICSGQTISIIPTVTPAGGTYLWSNNSTASSITVSPTQTTTYNLLYSLNGCNANGSGIINVTQNATPTFTALGPYCQNTIADQLSSTSLNGIQGTWNPSTINTSNPGNSTYTFTPNAGICATTATMNVTINPLIQTTFSQIPSLCQFETAPILPGSSNNNPPVNGTWTPSTINTNTIGTNTYVFSPNAGQCASNFTMSIDVNAAPNPDASASLQAGCIPLNVNLQTASIPGATYQWTANGVNIGSTPTLNTTFNASGCYNVVVNVTLGSCSSSAAIPNPICAEAAPTVFFTAFPSSFSSSSGNINFSPSNNNLATYSWDFGNGNTSTEISPTHSYSGVNGNVTVTLTATSALGCIGNYSLVLPYREQTLFYVPNSFTPDADEFNQTWGPVFTQGFDPYNFQLYIYNRWGELIWESKDAEGRWDGTYGIGGLKVPAGVYLWKIEYKPTNTDEKNIISGHINLLR